MDWSVFPIYLATCAAAASTGSMFKPGAWYDALEKPPWTPPNWVFPVVWSCLYVGIAVAAARVASSPDNSMALAFWALQIAFNTLWTPVFFGRNRIKAAFVIICGLWLSVAATMVTFLQIDAIAGAIFVPYLAWVSIATCLNFSVLQRNRVGKSVAGDSVG